MTETSRPPEVWSAVQDAVQVGLNLYGDAHGLPRITWTIQDGCVDGFADQDYFPDAERIPAVALWSDHLGLQPHRRAPAHTREWRGVSGGMSFSVWAITDVEAFWNRRPLWGRRR